MSALASKASALASKMKAASPSLYRGFQSTSHLRNEGSHGFISKDLSDIRLEMREFKHEVDRKLFDLDDKVTAGFELMQKSFDAFKSSYDLSLAKSQLQWTRYQLGTVALFTGVIANMFFEAEKQKVQASSSEKPANA